MLQMSEQVCGILESLFKIKIYENRFDFEDLMQIEMDDIIFYNEQLLGALSFIFQESGELSIEEFFSGNIYHSSSSLLNVANNIGFRLKQKDNSISLSNYPVSR